MNRKEFGDRLFCIFFPARCLNCGRVARYSEMFCGKCKIEKDAPEACQKKFLGVPVLGAVAGTLYSGNLKKAVWTLKGKADARIVYLFAKAMFDEIKINWPEHKIDCVTPVPISPAKLKSRGFNQAGALAKRLSELMKKPYVDGVLRKDDDSRVQHSLNIQQRTENAEKSFHIAAPGLVEGKTVLLVDDVLTTGATLRVCASLLLNAGAKAVYAAAASRTPDYESGTHNEKDEPFAE